MGVFVEQLLGLLLKSTTQLHKQVMGPYHEPPTLDRLHTFTLRIIYLDINTLVRDVRHIGHPHSLSFTPAKAGMGQTIDSLTGSLHYLHSHLHIRKPVKMTLLVSSTPPLP